MLATLALVSHLVTGFVPGTSFTVFIDDTPQMTVEVSGDGSVSFDTQTGRAFRIGTPPTPTEDEPAPDDDVLVPPPNRFTVAAYPNPAVGPLNVLISVPGPGPSSVRVDLFDAGGRSAGTLSLVISGSGRHRVAWDAASLESGLYFVRVRRGNEERFTRFTVVR